MPKKPTDTFGGWIFSKDGKVRHESDKLPDDKEGQEQAVIEAFIDRYNASHEPRIEANYRSLEEADHDFEIELGGAKIMVQVTEIIERDYVLEKGAAPTSGATEGLIRFKVGAPGSQQVDITKRNRALETAIRRKVEKYYSKPRSEFWLLVFATDVGFNPEHADAVFEKVLTPLEHARRYLGEIDCAFDQIWFLGLYKSEPVLVWYRPL
jgi:hypothetical protein